MANGFNINAFRANFNFSGVRPTQFKVILTPPQALLSTAVQKVEFLCHATQAPPMIQDSIRVYYFGRPIKVVGDRDYPDWTVSIYNDEDFAVRSMLESWSNLMNTAISNKMDTSVYPTGYKSVATIVQYGKDGHALRSYTMDGIFPVNVDAMGLSWDSVNQVQTFDCTFAYDLWYPGDEGDTATFNPVSADDGQG